MAQMVFSRKTLNTSQAKYVTREELIDLSVNNMYPGQRNHGKNLHRKTHVRGMLVGDSLHFHAAYSLADKKLWFLDGYHRAAALALGLASFPADARPMLICQTVRNKAEADERFAQFNSLIAAKRSGDYFDSAMRDCGVLELITSNLVTTGGRATGAQLAAGMLGSGNTKKAAMKVIDGIKFVDELQLDRRRFEIAGVLGVYFAVANYVKNERWVEEFIRNVNATRFAPSQPTRAEARLIAYREALLARTTKTGGNANMNVFAQGLAAFVEFAARKRGKRTPVPAGLTLSEFLKHMEKLA